MARLSAIFMASICCCWALLGGMAAHARVIRDTSTQKELRQQLRAQDPDTVILMFKQLLQHSITIDSPDGAFMALIEIGIKYWEKQDFALMRAYSIAAIPWAMRSPQRDAVAWCYSNIGESYYFEGDYLGASRSLYTALAVLRTADIPPNHTGANIYNALGRINIKLNQPEKALQYFAIGEDIAHKGNCFFQLGENYTERGAYYNNIHKPDSARKYFVEVMNIGLEHNKRDLVALANCNLGKTAVETGDYELAIAYSRQAIALAKGIYEYIVIDASYVLGDALFHQQKYDQAEFIFVTILQEIKSHNTRYRYIEGYTRLASLYAAKGAYKLALDCTDSLLAVKDSLASIAKATAYNQLEIKYNTAEKDKQIAQNQLLIARQQSKITMKNTWIAGIAMSILLCLLIIIGGYRAARHRQRLQAAQIRSLKQHNRIGTLKAIMEGEENERGRIARELHDGIGGMLAAAMMRFRTIHHDNKEVTQTPAYNDAMHLLDQMGDEIRKTAHNLMPEVLQKQSLDDAVRSFCHNMQGDGSLRIDFQSYGSFQPVSQEVKLNIYRILQELVKNIKHHADARHALVQLVINEHTLTVTVEDNGIGFDVFREHNGMGLHNIKTRVQSLGGLYNMESEAGKGTTVYIEFDLHTITAHSPL